MPIKPKIELQFPLGGLNRRLALQKQPPFTAYDMLNSLDRCPITGRLRGGSRPGQAKAIATQLGGGNPIRLAEICRTINLTGSVVYTDDFPGAAMSGDWSAGSFSFTDGLPDVAGGFAKTTSTAGDFRTAVLSDRAISITARRSVSLKIPKPNVGQHDLYLDLDDASPSETVGIRLTVGSPSTNQLTLFVDGVGVQTYAVGSQAVDDWVTLSIDEAKLITVTWRTGQPADILYTASSYSPAASKNRAGFGIANGAIAEIVQADTFRLEYIDSSGVNPRTMLVASSNGHLDKETTVGTFSQITSGPESSAPTGISLQSDRLLLGAAYEQKLYIADVKKRQSGTNAALGFSSPNGTLTDAAGDFINKGVTVADDRIEILPGGNGTVAVYEITARTATTITFTGDAGTHGSGVKYRVCRCAKVYDSVTNQLTKVPIGTIGAGNGQFPLNCSLIAAAMGRLWWSGDSDYPNYAYVSASETAIAGSTPEVNYFYDNETAGAAFAWDPARVEGSQAVGDEITAIIPHRDDYLIFGCRNSCFVQRGDPNLGGRLDIISPNVGIISPKGWAKLPDGSLVIATTDGFYRIAPSPEAVPLSVSSVSLPRELKSIPTAFDPANPTAGYDVQLEYDVERALVHAFVTPRAVGSTRHWFVRINAQADYEGILRYEAAFFPMTMPSGQEPTAIAAHTPSGGTRTVFLGGRDGYVRRFSDAADDDDGTDFNSYVVYGPFGLSSDPSEDGSFDETIVQLGVNSNSVRAYVQVGNSAEAASTAAFEEITESAIPIGAGDPVTLPVYRRGTHATLKLERSTGGIWSPETVIVKRRQLGRLRVG